MPAPSPVSRQISASGPRHRLQLAPLVRDLLADGLIRQNDLARARATGSEQRNRDMHPLVLLADLKLSRAEQDGRDVPLGIEELTQWLARREGLPYVRIDPTRVEVATVTSLFSLSYAQRHRILPLSVDAKAVTIATSEPHALDWQQDLRGILKREIKLVLCSPLDLSRYTMEFYGVTRSLRGAKQHQNEQAGLPSFEQLVDLGQSGDLTADDQHVVHIVDWLLQFAQEQRASDIHLEPRRDTSKVRFRIDGVLHKVFEMPTAVMTAAVSRIKVLGRMDLAERRRPQDGRIKTRSPTGREVEMRLSTMPTAFGEKCVMRLFDPDTAMKSIEQLGFDADEGERWQRLTGRPHGIVLVTGPTGSGKTTTLYSTLQRLATSRVNVCTVEDPIEMINPEFNQMQVQHQIGLSFAAGVRTLLRQDPDIIMIGEIRDLETGQMAVQAALTGHLVLSTLHTNDAPSALTRLLDLGVPHYLIGSTLNGVLAQRLVRTLCHLCKKPHPIPPADWASLIGRSATPPSTEGYIGVGCVECRHTGFRGRVGLYELLELDQSLRQQIRPDMDLSRFTAAAVDQGMRTLNWAAAQKVAAGQTTVAEVLTVLPKQD
ncbi:GspE/PulE family protein [Pseudomarimonas arenosa]|uniref:Flp pilus assembly complex ATPase component TadA n=1 Tax=Pseudomarimonas arenosa TaxID=2774145 RepID=A0AAW3ZKL2_9GAMM|nr:GspE/PulE family protein [Pseudomarimonas arenosa]MBD8525729.1 Flp pilus assembly complex ATPase component TadA [Pseudomarimonas arenosa]